MDQKGCKGVDTWTGVTLLHDVPEVIDDDKVNKDNKN